MCQGNTFKIHFNIIFLSTLLSPNSFIIILYTIFFSLTDWNKCANICKFHTKPHDRFTTPAINSQVVLKAYYTVYGFMYVCTSRGLTPL